jgi:predicted DNA-binding transcriptional regulator YafY
MRRADRLFRLVGLLQRRRTVTAAALAERLEVSERTVYRDIADLMGSGVPQSSFRIAEMARKSAVRIS